MKVFATLGVVVLAGISSLAQDIRAPNVTTIQPGGWVRVLAGVDTEITCVGTPKPLIKICRCDFDLNSMYRVELYVLSDMNSEKVIALTPYIYATYSQCSEIQRQHSVCTQQ